MAAAQTTEIETYLRHRRNALPDIFESVDVLGMEMLSYKCAQCQISDGAQVEDTPPTSPSASSSDSQTGLPPTCAICGKETTEFSTIDGKSFPQSAAEELKSADDNAAVQKESAARTLSNENLTNKDRTGLPSRTNTIEEEDNLNVAERNGNKLIRNDNSPAGSQENINMRREVSRADSTDSFTNMAGLRPETCAKLSLLC